MHECQSNQRHFLNNQDPFIGPFENHTKLKQNKAEQNEIKEIQNQLHDYQFYNTSVFIILKSKIYTKGSKGNIYPKDTCRKSRYSHCQSSLHY